jgi:non-ribosomal peptide synthetase component E (peptide arylation enzyme)
LTIAGRKKDIIIRKGENISAKEVEDLLGGHPAIEHVAVIGVADAVRGERVCAVVVPAPRAQPRLSDLAAWLDKHGLARQKIPEQLELVEALPRTASGKVRKNELRARFGGVNERSTPGPKAPPARSA